MWRGGNETMVEEKGNNNTSNEVHTNHWKTTPSNPFEQPNPTLSNYNPHFYGNLPPHLQNVHASQREQLGLIVIKRIIKSYFEIVKKNVADIVPKCIMLMLVNLTKQQLQQELSLSLYKEERFEDLLLESSQIAQNRKQANDLLNVLRKALAIINEVRDYKSIESFD